MRDGEHDTPREDRKEEETKEEEMKDSGPLDFVSELVKEAITNLVRQDLQSYVTLARAETQATRDTVTEGMMEMAKTFKDTQKEHAERMQLEMESLRIQLRSLEDRLQQKSAAPNHRSEGPKPSKPADFSGNRMKGKGWLCTICQYMDLRPHEFASDAITIGWILSFFKEGRVDGFAQEAYDFKERHEEQWKWSLLGAFLTEFREEQALLGIATQC
jgi:hypothetical protein